jgi:hypothetical protein
MNEKEPTEGGSPSLYKGKDIGYQIRKRVGSGFAQSTKALLYGEWV